VPGGSGSGSGYSSATATRASSVAGRPTRWITYSRRHTGETTRSRTFAPCAGRVTPRSALAFVMSSTVVRVRPATWGAVFWRLPRPLPPLWNLSPREAVAACGTRSTFGFPASKSSRTTRTKPKTTRIVPLRDGNGRHGSATPRETLLLHRSTAGDRTYIAGSGGLTLIAGLPQGYHFLTDAPARGARGRRTFEPGSAVSRRYALAFGLLPSGSPDDREQRNTGSHGLPAAFKVVTPVRIRSGVPPYRTFPDSRSL